jgi:hypothetical protein
MIARSEVAVAFRLGSSNQRGATPILCGATELREAYGGRRFCLIAQRGTKSDTQQGFPLDMPASFAL